MKGILKNTPAGWYVWYCVMRDEITSGYDSIPVYQETFDFNGKQPIIPLVEGKQVEFKIEDFWETGGDEGIKLAKLIIPKEEPKEETPEEVPTKLESVLAKINHQSDLGLSQWYEVVYYDGKWRSYSGSTTFKDGEIVVEWKYCKELF